MHKSLSTPPYHIMGLKRIFILSASCFFVLTAAAQNMRQNAAYIEYIERYKNIAIEQMDKYHIPASITMAQGLLESGAGRSELARKANNHFGIKCGSDWRGPTSHHDDDANHECFRSYKNAKESYEDHSIFLTTKKRYASLFRLNIYDYKGWARGLKAAGYATNPAYANNLIRIIETYSLDELDNSRKSKFITKIELAEAKSNAFRQIYQYNKNYYIRVKRGDTFKSLGKELGISYRKLAKYNERDKRDELVEGEVIYLKKKQKKAEKKYKGQYHVVQAGESMYSISQRYAIRMKYLYKRNKLSTDYQLQVGDKLRLR